MLRTPLFAAASALAVLTAAPAVAQDAPPEDNGFNGFYIGGSIGGSHTAQQGGTVLFDRNLDGRFGDTVTTAAGANAFSPGFCPGVATSTANENCTYQRDGLDYYGRIGGDTQRGRWVVGFVVEGGRPDFNESVSAFSTTPARYTLTRDIRYSINARGRIGYTPNDTTLFYGAFGPTYAKVRTRIATSNTANSFTPNGNQDQWGFNAGGGVEQKLGKHFSIGLEYLYTDVKANKGVVRVGPGTAPATNPFLLSGAGGTDFIFSNQRLRWHSVRAVATFRF